MSAHVLDIECQSLRVLSARPPPASPATMTPTHQLIDQRLREQTGQSLSELVDRLRPQLGWRRISTQVEALSGHKVHARTIQRWLRAPPLALAGENVHSAGTSAGCRVGREVPLPGTASHAATHNEGGHP